ncbi:hypothetical protein SASPL_122677 [Salvia splendens]|uniref:Tyrosine-protein kinase catalytic domain-containing protein n=1 Tax=Salvia splendens TaxID=180675 RepID=A0A8X8ZSP3_SALSN|nr:hypothetical protein SASPL_122677 [Salvia splendens]
MRAQQRGHGCHGRKWEPSGKYLVAGAGKSAATKAEAQDPSLPPVVPYMSARIFHSGATYQFSLQNSRSRTLLRLHFYPSSYPNVDFSKSYFGVVAGSVLLLNNFSGHITAQALSQSYLVKEYYLTPSKSPFLNVTFQPAENSFAFINGVEVIPAPEIFNEEPLLFIPPLSDSGCLMRMWYDDSVYIYGAGQGVAVMANASVGYKKLPPYTAPLDVYRSYRSMGAYVDVNKVSNLTWNFEIDPGFLLHWCDSGMVKVNQRVFDLFINNMTAAREVDLFGFTDAVATPITKDYVVVTENVTDAGYRLWISSAPTNGTMPQFMYVLLNGLEIFKLSDNFETNLAAPNPSISDLMRKGHKMEHKAFEENDSTIIIACGAGGAAAVGVAVALMKAGSNGDSRTSWLPISRNSNNTNNTKSSSVVAISTDAASNCRCFSLVEIINATNNFDESNIIGVGGFGKFQTEIEMLSRLRHRHLVSLIGFCEDNGEMILVYDYIISTTATKPSSQNMHRVGPRASLPPHGIKVHHHPPRRQEHQHPPRREMGGQGVGFRIVKNHVSKAVKGSFGYLDPEYFSRSDKSDVYSFGVVLFEVHLPQEQIELADWAPRNVRLGKLEEIIEPELKGRISLNSVATFTDVATRCLADHGGDRPIATEIHGRRR